MNKQKLEEYLLRNDTRLYCVLDGASVPKLPMRLYETQAKNVCLFSGDLEPDMLYVAPYLVRLVPHNGLTDWVLENAFGKHWGIFVHSLAAMPEMRKHFRNLVNVMDDQANSMVFRFYDPRVITKFLPTCTPEELAAFFGEVQTFFEEDATTQKLMSFQLKDGSLKQAELN
jgi:hypothetical protein